MKGSFDIYVMNADDGSDETRLTDTAGGDRSPSWSPDGEKISFRAIENPTRESPRSS